jgi:hypothetical protein
MRRALLVMVLTILAGATQAAALPAPGEPYHLLFASSTLYAVTPNQSFPPAGQEFGNHYGGGLPDDLRRLDRHAAGYGKLERH